MRTEKRLRRTEEGTPPLSEDQQAVFDAYFERAGAVCAPAGSGTGKTTTAVETVAEAVVREFRAAPDRNPFESVLVTTFTTDAARRLKADLRDRLREHRRAAPPGDPVVERWADLIRWLETDANVRTIDSFTHDLLREVAPDAGVAPSFGVADGIRRSDLLESVFADLRGDPDLADAVENLDRTFPVDGDGQGWESMVVEVHRRCREFCLSIPEARRELLSAVTAIHADREPEEFDDILAIIEAVTDFGAGFARDTIEDPEQWVEFARETYRESRRLAVDFGLVLAAFDRRYDRRSRERGVVTHTDITHLVWDHLAGGGDGEAGGGTGPSEGAGDDRREQWRESLARRFDHVVVDEFQDTNYAQCRILAHLVRDANCLLIGDLKQSVYEWRSAEPQLFADLLADARGVGDGNVLDLPDVRPVGLAENFRSHPHLVGAINHLFEELFDDPGRGDVGSFDVEYEHLEARRVETDPDSPHLHCLRIEDPEDDDRSRRAALVEREADRVAASLRAALDDGTLRVDRERATGDGDTDPDLEGIRPGDVAVLFRSRRYARTYADALDRYGIDSAILGAGALFQEPEVEAVVDALAWIGRPADPGATRRVVESPVAGLSADGRERVAGSGYDLDAALSEWDGSDADRRELGSLVALRDDLRTERGGSKADLVRDLLAHSGFDAAVLATGDGRQRYANLRQFVATVDGWEEDETIPYGEFMRRLDRLRSGRIDDDTALADVADPDSPGTVKLLTAHAAKGLEFPVVVLADTTRNEAYGQVCNEPLVADRRHGLALRPTCGGRDHPPGELPNFDGGWFHEDEVDYDFDRGILWLSEIRDGDGRIRHDHPLSAHVRDRRAEFWRLLYVAVTRACDHLVVPLADPGPRGEWTTWAAALGEYLDPEDGVLETPDGPVPVGVDDLDTADPPGTGAVDLDRLLDPEQVPGTDGSDGDYRFVPGTLAASGLRTALDDPRGFQQSVLWGLGRLDPTPREDPPTGTGGSAIPPDVDLAPDAWGRAVHAVLEAVGRADDPTDHGIDPASVVGSELGRTPPDRAVETITDRVLPAYAATGIPGRLADADPVLPEFGVATTVGVGDHRTFLRGQVDLLYRVESGSETRSGSGDRDGTGDEGWQVVEFKTTAPPESGSDRDLAHRTQARAYAWAVWRVHGIDPDVRVVYLPAETVREVDSDPAVFAGELADGLSFRVEEGALEPSRE